MNNAETHSPLSTAFSISQAWLQANLGFRKIFLILSNILTVYLSCRYFFADKWFSQKPLIYEVGGLIINTTLTFYFIQNAVFLL